MNDVFGILTMTRGDEERIEHWVRYHVRLGFSELYIVLDNPVDNTESVLKKLSGLANIHIIFKGPNGPYYEADEYSSMWEKRKQWLVENKLEIERMGLPINDEISWRQYKYFPGIIQDIINSEKITWISIIDVDEYIDLIKYENIEDLVKTVGGERIRFRNFNYNTSESFPIVKPVTETAKYRWSYEDIVKFGKGWDERCKSIVKVDKALPLVSVHAISKGSFKVVDHREAKLNHYKYPLMKNIPYTVCDPLNFKKWCSE